MNEPIVTIVGNLTADPDLRFLSSGVPVCNFTVASTPRIQNKQSGQWEDGEPMFVRCSVWREYAENVAESLSKGMRVVVTGRMTVRSYQTDQGQDRQSLELQVDEIGPSLRYARVTVERTARNGANSSPAGRRQPHAGEASNYPSRGSGGPQNPNYDPWAGGVASSFDDAPPF